PLEECAAEVVSVGERDAHNGMPGAGERGEPGRGVALLIPCERHVNEYAVPAVRRRRTDGLVHDGHDAFPFLAGALGDQLLDPQSEACDARRQDEGGLVTTVE